MGIDWMEKGTPRQAVDSIAAGGTVISGIASVTADLVLCLGTQRRVVDSKLGVVENVECFGAKLDVDTFKDGKILLECHVPVPPAGIVQRVSACGSKRKTARRDKRRGIQQEWTKTLAVIASWRSLRAGRNAGQVRIGARSNSVRDARVVQCAYSSRAAIVNDCKRNSSLEQGYSA